MNNQANISTQIQQLSSLLLSNLELQSSFVSNQQNEQQNMQINYKQFVQKMKSIQSIVLNSLKLNQKIYTSIIEKQALINSNANSFINSTNDIDMRIQDSIKRNKQLYEDTVHQNQKARFLLEQFISPIREELRSKVDQTTFTLQMKIILDQYDNIGHKITYDNQLGRIKQQQRKTINSQTLMFLRDKILPLISSIQINLQKNVQKTQDLTLKMQQIASKSRFLQQQFTLQNEQIKQIQKKLISKINQRFNDSFIEKKLKQSMKNYMIEFREDISTSIAKVDRYAKNVQSNFNSQIEIIKTSLSSFLANQKASENSINSKIQKLSSNFEQSKSKNEQKMIQNNKIIKGLKRLQQLQQTIAKIKNLQKNLQKLQGKLQKGDFSSSLSLKDEDFKNLVKKLNNFETQTKKIKKFQKQIQQKISIQKGQINGIRDILSKKANFSDILHHIDNKVDRQEFKQFKQKTSQQLKWQDRQQRSPSFVIKQSQQSQVSGKSRHIKSKSFFSPSPKQKIGDIQNQSQSIKRFKLGFNNQFPISKDQIKKQYSKTQYLRHSIMNNSLLVNQQQS